MLYHSLWIHRPGCAVKIQKQVKCHPGKRPGLDSVFLRTANTYTKLQLYSLYLQQERRVHRRFSPLHCGPQICSTAQESAAQPPLQAAVKGPRPFFHRIWNTQSWKCVWGPLTQVLNKQNKKNSCSLISGIQIVLRIHLMPKSMDTQFPYIKCYNICI